MKTVAHLIVLFDCVCHCASVLLVMTV